MNWLKHWLANRRKRSDAAWLRRLRARHVVLGQPQPDRRNWSREYMESLKK